MAYELKTRQTPADVDAFLAAAEPASRRDDARAVCALMARVSGLPASMWGPSIVGFGSYRYRYDSGHQGEMCRMGFSPRKAALVLYLPGCPEREALDGLRPLFSEIGRTYAPVMLANAQALAKGADEVEAEVDGQRWVQAPFPYQAKCLQWLKASFAALTRDDQGRVRAALDGCGCEPLLD